jgi:CRP-like cAMP-binding protein
LNASAKHQFRNRILSGLPKGEISRLAPQLQYLTFDQGFSLQDGGTPYGYFLEEGIASAVVTLKEGETVEVGVVGCDGFVGLPALLGTPSPPGRIFIQIAGAGYRLKAKAIKEEYDQPGELRQRLNRYIQAQMVQSSQTAACNRLHPIEGRLARWLLSCRDRMPGNELRLTHSFLGQMLGAPRTTVTATAGLLQRAGLIDYARGKVTIRDRSGLEETTCECYRTVRDEYRRLGLL